MEVGKFYRGKYTHSIIMCTGLNKDGVNFSGTIIEIGDGSIDSMNYVGATSDYWACASFEECSFKSNLENNSSYNIPDGCTATIKENKVVIKDKIEYYKSCLTSSSSIVYTRIKKRDIVKFRVYSDGDIDIFFRKYGCSNDNDLGEPISEDVFTKEYNKVLNKMKL